MQDVAGMRSLCYTTLFMIVPRAMAFFLLPEELIPP